MDPRRKKIEIQSKITMKMVTVRLSMRLGIRSSTVYCGTTIHQLFLQIILHITPNVPLLRISIILHDISLYLPACIITPNSLTLNAVTPNSKLFDISPV